MPRRTLWLLLATLATVCTAPTVAIAVEPVRTFDTSDAEDQDDMCFWIHPTDSALSKVIGSDKTAGALFVYDLAGDLVQTVASPQPGNVDVRYGIRLGGECIDVIAHNERDEEIIRLYRIDATTGRLDRIDDGTISTGPNYGFALYRHVDGSLYGFTGPKESDYRIRKFALYDDGAGRLTGHPTGWQFQQGTVEGMVGDDETGYVYLSEEAVGLWKLAVTDTADRTLVAQVGDESGLAADVEGVAIYHAATLGGYLIASSQGDSKFTVLDRRPPHAPVGEFRIQGASVTDGIDVLNQPLGDAFPTGIFAAHDDSTGAVQAIHWAEVGGEISRLIVDTSSWNPRAPCVAEPRLQVTRTTLSWNAVPGAIAYDVVVGDLKVLRGTGGDLTVATTACVANDTQAHSLEHLDRPSVGEGLWFLARGLTGLGPLTYESLGVSQRGRRDEALATGGLACP